MNLAARQLLYGALLLLVACHIAAAAELGGADWIGWPKHTRLKSAAGNVYFRKLITIPEPEYAQIAITCDDKYELIVNGKRVGTGNDWRTIKTYDLVKYLTAGTNVVAVRGENQSEGPGALVAHIKVHDGGGQIFLFPTNDSWKTSLDAARGWDQSGFDDDEWQPARKFGQFGQIAPWGDQPRVAGEPSFSPDRFTPQKGFRVEEVVAPGQTGSLVAMAFNRDGNIIASREGGPLLLLRDGDRDGQFESVTTYCTQVQNCQGILPLDGQVYTVGYGPSGTAFYRLNDENGDGTVEQVTALMKYSFGMAEHGPHAAVLGPDGLIYLMMGNYASTRSPPSRQSPLHDWYDVDLLKPKYEDANGHAAGLKAPGGVVARVDRSGQGLQFFAGGLRNSYDFALNRDGDFFTYDSDMEWDVGLPWYRPTRINHITQGSDAGWRSGWSTWPPYYLDSVPPILNIGRGSPTGVEHYDHTRYPQRYRGALFMCDWSQGRVLAVTLKPSHGSYEATSEIFLEGRPLNCSDIAVGPDGCLYVCVGGRGTQGSVFRIAYGQAASGRPETQQGRTATASAVEAAIGQPQLYSDWARRNVLRCKEAAGANWASALTALATDAGQIGRTRIRAVELLELFGPLPDEKLLLTLSQAGNADVRAKSVYLLGVHAYPSGGGRLIELLDDPDPRVRRLACEALVRSRTPGPAAKLVELLGDRGRFVRWAARRALEQLPVAGWKPLILETREPQIFAGGAIGLLVVDPSRNTAQAVIARALAILDSGGLSTDATLDLLRVMEVAIDRGRIEPDELASLGERLLAIYPAKDYRLNREASTLLIFLQQPPTAARMVAQLASDIPLEEKIHVLMRSSFLKTGWNSELRRQVLKHFEQVRSRVGGNSYAGYLANATNDFLKTLALPEKFELLVHGAEMPSIAEALLADLPDVLTANQQRIVRRLDEQVTGRAAAAATLSRPILAVLARGDRESLAHVRRVFDTAPERRADVVRALTSQVLRGRAHDEDWPLLVQSLSFAEGTLAPNVLEALRRMDQRSADPKDLRRVIVLGLKLQDQGGREAAALLEHWTGKKPASSTIIAKDRLTAWQQWFVDAYPDLPPPTLPVQPAGTKWTYSQLSDFLATSAGQGSAQRGAVVFEKAQCIKCHRYGDRGQGIGPDLSNVSRRFQRKEILESVIYPSQIIPDQFQAKIVITNDGKQYVGIVGPNNTGVTVYQSNGEKVEIAQDDIDEVELSKTSAMPEDLFKDLTLKEIADLFAYLAKPAVN